MAMSFGEVVRFHRTRLGLTQEKLAAKMERSYTRVQKVEQGQALRRLPNAEEFRLWADALEVSPKLLLQQLGYIDDEAAGDRSKHAEVIFTSCEYEIHSNDSLPKEVREIILDSIKHARWLHDALSKQGAASKPSTPLQGVLIPASAPERS